MPQLTPSAMAKPWPWTALSTSRPWHLRHFWLSSGVAGSPAALYLAQISWLCLTRSGLPPLSVLNALACSSLPDHRTFSSKAILLPGGGFFESWQVAPLQLLAPWNLFLSAVALAIIDSVVDPGMAPGGRPPAAGWAADRSWIPANTRAAAGTTRPTKRPMRPNGRM